MTFAQHLLSWPITRIAAKRGVPPARWLCNCSGIQLSNNMWPALFSATESFPLRPLCVTTSRAEATFRSTSSGSVPTLACRTAQVKCIIRYKCSSMLMAGTAGIAASNYSHVHQFPSRKAYDDYYDRVVDIGEVGGPKFADRIQDFLVDYIYPCEIW